jgi:hypothetical protein
MFYLVVERLKVINTEKYNKFNKDFNSKYLGFSYSNEITTLIYNEQLTQNEINEIINRDSTFIDSDQISHVIINVISPARQFGNEIIDRYAAENVLLGITQLGKTKEIRHKTKEITDCLKTGSLYDAIDEIKNFPDESKDDIFITNERLLATLNLIESFLGIPLTEII